MSTSTENTAERTVETDTRHWRYWLQEFSEIPPIITFLVIFIFFSFAAENFLSGASLGNVLTFASINGIMVVGVAMLMIGGEFDLSVGSVLAVSSYVVVLTINAGWNPYLGILLALVVSAGLGLVNGLLVIYTDIPSFIVTLGGLLAYRGLARWIGSGDFLNLDPEIGEPAVFGPLNGPIGWLNDMFTPPGQFRYGFIWFLVIVIIGVLVMTKTRFGNWIAAVGGNAGAATAQGVNFKMTKLSLFMISSTLAGLAGVVQFAQLTSVDPLRGFGLELIVISGAVIGGVFLTGGFGSITGAAFGILMLSLLRQGLVLMNINLEYFQGVLGLLIILAVMMNTSIQKPET